MVLGKVWHKACCSSSVLFYESCFLSPTFCCDENHDDMVYVSWFREFHFWPCGQWYICVMRSCLFEWNKLLFEFIYLSEQVVWSFYCTTDTRLFIFLFFFTLLLLLYLLLFLPHQHHLNFEYMNFQECVWFIHCAAPSMLTLDRISCCWNTESESSARDDCCHSSREMCATGWWFSDSS